MAVRLARDGGLLKASMVLMATVFASNACAQQASAAGRTITIPEGTPVKVHIYGVSTVQCNAKVKPQDAADLNTGNWVIQADEAVVVEGAVVVPAGSVGLLHVKASYDKKSLGFDLATAHVTTAHYCTIQLVSILAADDSELKLDTEPIALAPPLPGIWVSKYGGIPSTLDVQLTGRLKQATVTVPVTAP